MKTEQLGNTKGKRNPWWKLFSILMVSGLLYGASYLVNSFCGGYWMIPEMDGHDRYSFGLAMPMAVLWQPRYGHEAIGSYDFLGTIYKPLIRVDRKFFHPTIYLSDDNGFDRATHLPASKVHPDFRDGYVTKFTANLSCDEAGHKIICTMRLTGSSSPRTLTTIQMSREMSQTLGVSAPEGFIEKPWIETYMKSTNEKYIRWAGKVPLPRDTDVILNIPAKQPLATNGTIRFQCERNQKSIDQTKIIWAKLEGPPRPQK